MWEFIKVAFLSGLFVGFGTLTVLMKDRREETEDMVVDRMAAYLSETLRINAPFNPIAQIAYCRQLFRDRIEEGIDRVRYSRILTEALHRNWPHLPRDYFAAAFQ